MKVTFCGVRGSTPAPGAEFVGVGGHTSCLAVTAADEDRPRLILDAGTGIREVTALLGGRPFEGTILLSHLHWDHVQGLPFFAAADRPGAVVELGVPDAGPGGAEATLERALSPPHFPIRPSELQGTWTFSTVRTGDEASIAGLTVRAAEVPHKGGTTLGYRVTDPRADTVRTLGYLPDHLPSPAGPQRAAVLDLVGGVDVLVHDAQFVAGEEAVAVAYGHSTVAEAVALAIEAGVGRLVLFHHAPARTDAEVEGIGIGAKRTDLRVLVARQGLVLGD